MHLDAAVVVTGILIGGLYATVALGLSLVFGVMRLVNLAYGELLVGGAYLSSVVVSRLGVDPLLSLLIVAPAAFALAYPLQRLLFTNLLRRGLEPPLVAAFGVSLLLQAALLQAFSADARSLPAGYATRGLSLLGVQVRLVYMVAFGVGAALVVATHLVLTRTEWGVALRAAALDPQTATTMGVDVRHLYAVTFGVSAALASVAGVLVGIAFSFSPTSGAGYLLIGMTVVVLGGAGNVLGALVGGVLIGVVQSAGGAVFGGQYRDLVVYVAFVALLAVRPDGILRRPGAAA